MSESVRRHHLDFLLRMMLPSLERLQTGEPSGFFAKLQMTLPILARVMFFFIFCSCDAAASWDCLCIFVPENQARSVQPWAAEDDDFARAPVQVMQQERPGAECLGILAR